MARIELTAGWVKCITGESARWHDIRLTVWYVDGRWRGECSRWGVPYVSHLGRRGPFRRSLAKAKLDAEQLAVEMVEDVAQTVDPWLAQYGMEVEDG